MRPLVPLLLGVCLAGYVVFVTTLGRFPATDEAYFKSPGREWAVSGRFVATEFPGFWDLDPPLERIWFPYVPLYPFLFGLLVKVVGFGWRQCVLYDALIHAVLAWLTYLLMRKLAPTLPRWLALLVGLAILPLGTWGRPDELAMCFGMAGCLLLLHESLSAPRAATSGVLFGLAAATSTGAALVLGMIAFLLMLIAPARLLQKVCFGFVWAGAATLVLAACVAPVLAAEPHAYRQYLAISGGVFGKTPIVPGFLISWQYGKSVLGVIGVCLVLSILGTATVRRQLPRFDWLKFWAGPACGLAFLTVALAGRYLYLWFVGPWLLSAAVITVTLWARGLVAPFRYGPVLLLFLSLLAGWLPFTKQTLELLTLPEAQQISYNRGRLHELIPAGATVLSDDYWWVLAGDYRVYSAGFSLPWKAPAIQYVVQTTIGSGVPGLPHDLGRYASLVEHDFEPIYDNLDQHPLRIFGVPLSRSANGFGVLVSTRPSVSESLPSGSDAAAAP
jgi:hypothetical protein